MANEQHIVQADSSVILFDRAKPLQGKLEGMGLIVTGQQVQVLVYDPGQGVIGVTNLIQWTTAETPKAAAEPEATLETKIA